MLPIYNKGKKSSKNAGVYPFVLLAPGGSGLYLHSLHGSLESAERQALSVAGAQVKTRAEAKAMSLGTWR